MFPVKWNKLQLTVDINFDVVVQSVLLCRCFLGKERRRESIPSSFKRRWRNSRVEAMKHQGSPLICIMYSGKASARERKAFEVARCDEEVDQTNILLPPTRRYAVQSPWENTTRENRVFLRREGKHREKSSEGEMLGAWEGKTFLRTTSVVEISRRKETRRHSIVCFSVEKT